LATHASSGVQDATVNTNVPEMESSLDAIAPDSIFQQPASGDPIKLPSRDVARQAIANVLQQLRLSADVKTVEEAKELQRQTDEEVKKALIGANVEAQSLHHFVVSMLKHSRDPRRMPIASRLFAIAFGVEPMSLPDPTAPRKGSDIETPGVDESREGEAVAGKQAWAVNAAGYNWASMVLSGQAAPPPGLHIHQRGSKEARDLITEQQAAAIRIYATLAMRGDAQGMLGMGRILVAGLQRQATAGGAKTDEKQKQQTELMRTRAIGLWTRAGEKGVTDAWFELGLFTLAQADPKEGAEAQARAEQYFERGAQAGNSRCHHALGVYLTQRAMQDNRSPSTDERNAALAKSLDHFRQAADMGDGESAHHLGMRYLLRQEMMDETGLGSEQDGRSPDAVRQQASERHAKMWGVEPDDVQARQWFAKAADAGFMPAMMNFAGMLVEQRGQEISAAQTTDETRIRDLRRAESMYAKVAATASALARQQQQAQGENKIKDSTPENDTGALSTGHMAAFAQEALGRVQEELQKVVKGSSSTTPS
jgi:hypothetical protein